MNRFIATLLISTLLALTACGTAQLYRQQLISLNKGMSAEQASLALNLPPLSTHQTSIDGVNYTFQRYYLNNGVISDLYLLCFEAEKLKYWGYVEEFRKYPDPRINKALEAVLPEIRAIKN